LDRAGKKMDIKETINKLVRREDLTTEETREAMGVIMEGNATPAQIAAFLTALRMKGETPEEITGCAIVMREKVTRCPVDEAEVIDTCGTGGDRLGTFNISTAAALVAAGAGVKVAKHGNRSVSSSSGSADVLKALGVNIEADVQVAARCIREAGIGFLYAPLLHPAMKYAIGPRREMGIRTIFNVLGPLTNPAGAKRQLMGVYSAEITENIAEVLRNLGSEKALVVHGLDGVDELSISDETVVSELAGGSVKTYNVKPEDFGLGRVGHDALAVTSPDESARVITEVLGGTQGPARDVVILNSASAIFVAGRASTIREGMAVAAESIDSGGAKAALRKIIEISNA
jgi:anthranilate phosphoribosyltransferase